MCFHSPYAGFWHLYTFPKLLSISKEINFCLELLCKTGLLLRGCGCSGKQRFSSAEVTRCGGGWGWKQVVLSVCGWKLGPSADRRKCLLLRETNCFLGQQAVIVDFLPYACFSERERETETLCASDISSLWPEEGQSHVGDTRFSPNLHPVPLLSSFWPWLWVSFIPTIPALGTYQDVCF
jgi:hypothetical protein